MPEVSTSFSETLEGTNQREAQPHPMRDGVPQTRSRRPKSHPVPRLNEPWICCNCRRINTCVEMDAVCGKCHIHQRSQCCTISLLTPSTMNQSALAKTQGSLLDGNAGDWQHMSGTCRPLRLDSRANEADRRDNSPLVQDDSQNIGSPRPFLSVKEHKVPKVQVPKRRSKINLKSSVETSADDMTKDDRSDTDTGGNGDNEIRLRANASAPLSLQFNVDREGRTLRMIPHENDMADLVISGRRKREKGLQSTYYNPRDVIPSNQPSKYHPVAGIRRGAPRRPTKLYEDNDPEGSEESTSGSPVKGNSHMTDRRYRPLRNVYRADPYLLDVMDDKKLKKAQEEDEQSVIPGQRLAKSRGLRSRKDSPNKKEQEVALTQPWHKHDRRRVPRLQWHDDDADIARQRKGLASRPTNHDSNLDDIRASPISTPPRIASLTDSIYQTRNVAVEHASNTESGSKTSDTREPQRQFSVRKAAIINRIQVGTKAKILQKAKISEGKRPQLSLDLVKYPSESEAHSTEIHTSPIVRVEGYSYDTDVDVISDLDSDSRPSSTAEMTKDATSTKQSQSIPQSDDVSFDGFSVLTLDPRGLKTQPPLKDASDPKDRDVYQVELHLPFLKLKKVPLADALDHLEFPERPNTLNVDHIFDAERSAKQSPMTVSISGQALNTAYPGSMKESIHASLTATNPTDDDNNEIDRHYPDNISQPSSYAASFISSVFSMISLASSASAISGSSGYSTVQIETATKVLLSIFHEDAMLLPLYKSAIDNPSVGPERLQRNLRRIFKAYAGQLETEATERLEYLASRLVLVKSGHVANSLVEKLRGSRSNSSKSGGERHDESSDEDDDEDSETRPVNEEAFEDLVVFREFLVESQAFKTLRAQVQAFVMPKSTHVAEALNNIEVSKGKSMQQCSSKPALQLKTHLTWQNWLEGVKHAVDALFCQRSVTMTAKSILYLGTDALILVTDDILIATGHLELALRPDMTRLRWRCDCGDPLYSDVLELREGGIAEPIDNMYRTSGAKVHASSYNRQTGNQQYIAPRPGQWIRNAVTKIGSALTGPTQPSTCLPQHNTQSPSNACSVSNNPAPQQKILHLLTCMHRNQLRKVLHQDRIEDVTTDRTLLCFLQNQYLRHRGRFLHMISLKSVKGIFFVKFRLPIGGSVDVRHHNPCCVAASVGSVKCECIPPPPKVEPSPGAEYSCIPGPPVTYPPIPPEYLSSLFTCPTDVHKQDTWILDQLPKRTCGKLQGQIGKPAEGWGIYYQEGWDRDIITLAILVVFVLASLLFGVLWSRFQYDVQGAFGVSAYIVASCAVILPVVATRAEKLG